MSVGGGVLRLEEKEENVGGGGLGRAGRGPCPRIGVGGGSSEFDGAGLGGKRKPCGGGGIGDEGGFGTFFQSPVVVLKAEADAKGGTLGGFDQRQGRVGKDALSEATSDEEAQEEIGGGALIHAIAFPFGDGFGADAEVPGELYTGHVEGTAKPSDLLANEPTAFVKKSVGENLHQPGVTGDRDLEFAAVLASLDVKADKSDGRKADEGVVFFLGGGKLASTREAGHRLDLHAVTRTRRSSPRKEATAQTRKAEKR